jgi:hypothetical protein
LDRRAANAAGNFRYFRYFRQSISTRMTGRTVEQAAILWPDKKEIWAS